MKKIPLIFGIINLLFQVVYSTLGSIPGDDYIWVFYIFRPEYLIISGPISFAMLIAAVILLFKYRKDKSFIYIVISVILHIEFLAFYNYLLKIN